MIKAGDEKPRTVAAVPGRLTTRDPFASRHEGSALPTVDGRLRNADRRGELGLCQASVGSRLFYAFCNAHIMNIG